MDYRLFKEKLFEKASQKFDKYEIFLSDSKSANVEFVDDDLKEYKNAESTGVSFRGIKGDMEGYSYSEKIDDEAVDFLIEKAYECMEAVAESGEVFMYSPDAEKAFSENIESLDDISEWLEKGTMANQRIRSLSDKVHSVEAFVSSEINTKYIANSEGVDCVKSQKIASEVVYVIVKDGDAMKGWYEVSLLDSLDEAEFLRLAEMALNGAESALGSKTVKSGKYDVVFTPMAFAALLEALSPAFNGLKVIKNMSPIKDKIGETIASDVFTLTDNVKVPVLSAYSEFDDEGVPSKDVTLIENGVLKSYVHTIETAHKLGQEACGNASRTYKQKANPGFRYLTVKAGEKIPDVFDKPTLEINSLAGLHSGLDPVSGVFSLQAEGKWRSGTEVNKPVSNIIIASNLLELFKSIKSVGDDMRLISRVYTPSVLVENMIISGD